MNYKAKGFTAITPYLVLKDLGKFLSFAESGLGAEVIHKMDQGEVVHHAEFRFDDAFVMAGEAKSASETTPAMLYFYVPDCDSSYRRALEAGASSVLEPQDQSYGDRNAAVRDEWGNQWWFATHKEDLSPEEMEKRMKDAH